MTRARLARPTRLLLALTLAVLGFTGCKVEMATSIVDEYHVTHVLTIWATRDERSYYEDATRREPFTKETVCGAYPVQLPGGSKREGVQEGDLLGCRLTVPSRDLEIPSLGSMKVSRDRQTRTWRYSAELPTYVSKPTHVTASVTFPKGSTVKTKSGRATVAGSTVSWNSPDDLDAGLRATAVEQDPLVAALPAIGLGALVVALATGGVVAFLASRRPVPTLLVPVVEEPQDEAAATTPPPPDGPERFGVRPQTPRAPDDPNRWKRPGT